MLNVKMSRVTGGTALRTDTIIGNAEQPPVVGKSFMMVGSALDPAMKAGIRLITTSPVVNLSIKEKVYVIETETGSVYTIEVLGETKSN